ncbi:hypothetical protein BW737_000675 [Actinomyces ruminis]|uniref:Uncharacterized protein n=1 Tax=Actinomyces ruminis TaxID=1937003 RepID=A0ABX4ME36_9ACTO|nr:hypothetical protein BW737_000675 [Actinomyces ruminis]
MTVPARPQSIRATALPSARVGNGRGAGVTRSAASAQLPDSSGSSSKRAPSVVRAARMSAVSCERRAPRSVVGPSATAAATRARAVSDFDPGRSTTVSSGPVAAGAGQADAVPMLTARR